jgi:hypothetical protein
MGHLEVFGPFGGNDEVVRSRFEALEDLVL